MRRLRSLSKKCLQIAESRDGAVAWRLEELQLTIDVVERVVVGRGGDEDDALALADAREVLVALRGVAFEAVQRVVVSLRLTQEDIELQVSLQTAVRKVTRTGDDVTRASIGSRLRRRQDIDLRLDEFLPHHAADGRKTSG